MKNKSKKEIFEMKKVLLVLVLSILFPIVSHAQVDREETRSVLVHFRQGAVTLDENYMDNKATLTEFANLEKSGISSELTVTNGTVTVNVGERPILVFSE